MNSGRKVCYVCGDLRAHMMSEHHAVPQRYNGSDHPENVYDLCANCHTAIEKMYDEDFYNRLVVKLGLQAPARQYVDHGDEDEDSVEGQPIDGGDEHRRACKAVYDESILEGSGGEGWVELDSAAERIRQYLPDNAPIDTPELLWGNLLEYIPNTHLKRRQLEEVTHLRCTSKGSARIFATGSEPTTGGSTHRMLLRECYGPLTEAGLTVEILEQDGSKMADAVGYIEDHPLLRIEPDDTAVEIADRVREFEWEHPILYRLTEGRNVVIEAEHSSGRTKPASTLGNLAHAANRGQRCLFIATHSVAESLQTLLVDDPVCMRSFTGDNNEYARLYNRSDLRINAEKVLRPASATQTVWLYDRRTGEYVLHDSDGVEHARFDKSSDIYDLKEKYPAIESEVSDSDEYVPIKNPIVPSLEFTDGIPDEDMWDILVPENGELYLYGDSEMVPLDEAVGYDPEPSPLADF